MPFKMSVILIYLFIICLLATFIEFSTAIVLVKYLEEGNVVTGNEEKISGKFDIYCYKGRSKDIIYMWETVQLQLFLQPDEFTIFDGFSPEDVKLKYENQQRTWNFNIFTKRQYIKLNPFNQTCIGLVSDKVYDVKLHRIRVDYWRILQCLCGFALFFAASSLSTNTLFYYLTGMSLGVLMSVLIVVYILSRFIPRKSIMYSFLAGGWAVGIYVAQSLWNNVTLIAMEYKSYVFYYIFGTGLLSFIICYRYGPVSDPKSINLIKWALQGVSLTMVLFSSDFQEASMSLDFFLLIYYNFPMNFCRPLLFKFKKWWYPVRPRLLTEDEYHQQTIIETEKALDKLRGFCSSPECNQWRTVLKLKNPLRFAEFMEGSSHIEDDEVLAFETDTKGLVDLLTDDESSSNE